MSGPWPAEKWNVESIAKIVERDCGKAQKKEDCCCGGN